MLGFDYYTPTLVRFGKDTESSAGEMIKAFGGSRELVLEDMIEIYTMAL